MKCGPEQHQPQLNPRNLDQKEEFTYGVGQK
jgi:hypothetical protein